MNAGLMSPKSATRSTSRRRNVSARPLASNAARVGSGSDDGIRTDRSKPAWIDRIVLDPIVQRGVDEDVRTNAEDGCRQDDEGDDRESQPGSDAAQHLSGPPQRTAL